jgi:hypothetical protein
VTEGPVLLLFARAPEPGRVKTRLHPALGPAGAARLYEAFLADAARAFGPPAPWSGVVCTDSESPSDLLAGLFPAPWRLRAQSGRDLGDRLESAFREAFEGGAPAAVAVGADHPALPRSALARVVARVSSGCAACLVPAEDGGYCAIGLARTAPLAEVFRGVPWSTGKLLAATLERLAAAGLRYALLPPFPDVDRPEDLPRLAADLAARDPGEPDYPRATAAALAALAAGRPR